MKSAIIVASLFASAAAFAPSQVAKSTTALSAKKVATKKIATKKIAKKPAKKVAKKATKTVAKKAAAPATGYAAALGAQPPLGFWDPMGMLAGDVDQSRFDRLRYVELKHGRIGMLAFLGNIITRAGIHFPGEINYAGEKFDSFPNGIAAIVGPDSIPTAGLVQLIALIGWLEIAVMKDVAGTGNEFVGDFRNGYIDFGWDNFSEEQKLQKRAIELNNGRAAMLGIIGLMVHEEIVPLGYDADLPIIGHLS